MILTFTNRVLACAGLLLLLNACTETSGVASGGTEIAIAASPSPLVAAPQSAGSKSFTNDLGDTITLTRAYLVIANTEVEANCGPNFTAALEGLLDFFIGSAQAHTESTPTATGAPYVINLLGADNLPLSLGSVSPPPADYCGLHVDLLAADSDAANLPTGVGEPNMVGRTIHLEGSYTLAGGGSGTINISTGASLQGRDVLLSALIPITRTSPTGQIGLGIQYDTWFNAIDLAQLEVETSPLDPQGTQLLINISASIHQR